MSIRHVLGSPAPMRQEARLDRLEEPARRTRQVMAALFGDGRLEA